MCKIRIWVGLALLLQVWSAIAIPIPTLPPDDTAGLPVSLSGMMLVRVNCVSSELMVPIQLIVAVTPRTDGSKTEKVVVYRYGGHLYRVVKTVEYQYPSQVVRVIRDWAFDGEGKWYELDVQLPKSHRDEFWETYAEMRFSTTAYDLRSLAQCKQ